MANFIHDDFLLQSEPAKRLYHDYAEKMPIYDYHCHLPAGDIAEDRNFENITQVWLYGDHYKWRAMRTNGVDERFITGDASDKEKFIEWAKTVPKCLRNPLYHWTHLELKRYFGIDTLLNGETADEIFNRTEEMLQSPEFSARGLMEKMNVKLTCTTEDPLDKLADHIKMQADDFAVTVHTAWRPDKAMNSDNPAALNMWIDGLEKISARKIDNCYDYLEAIKQRHNFFHKNGCRLSDHGLDTIYAADYDEAEIDKIFRKIRTGKPIDQLENVKFKSAMLIEFALMDSEKGWVQQFHIGALRSNNTKMLQKLGPDTGFDSIDDLAAARPMARFFDKLDLGGNLAKTILYNLNPRDNEVYATMIGNFQDGKTPGKMQFGSGWWFLDQKDGMERQIEALSNLGLLSRFVGMLTDSRSFLSYPRHEYFRRVLCNVLGNDIDKGLIPNDMSLLGGMVEDICYNNAANYFPMELK